MRRKNKYDKKKYLKKIKFDEEIKFDKRKIDEKNCRKEKGLTKKIDEKKHLTKKKIDAKKWTKKVDDEKKMFASWSFVLAHGEALPPTLATMTRKKKIVDELFKSRMSHDNRPVAEGYPVVLLRS